MDVKIVFEKFVHYQICYRKHLQTHRKQKTMCTYSIHIPKEVEDNYLLDNCFAYLIIYSLPLLFVYLQFFFFSNTTLFFPIKNLHSIRHQSTHINSWNNTIESTIEADNHEATTVSCSTSLSLHSGNHFFISCEGYILICQKSLILLGLRVMYFKVIWINCRIFCLPIATTNHTQSIRKKMLTKKYRKAFLPNFSF